MAAGRDIFLVLERDGTLYPGLIDLGITQERGRVEGQWFATSHRFAMGDINDDGRQDLAVFKEEIRPGMTANSPRPHTMPDIKEHPIRWYVYQPTSHSWIYQKAFDGQSDAAGCPRELSHMPMTPVEFVKQMYHLK